MVSTSFMVDTSSHPRAQLHRCVERSAYGAPIPADQIPKINGPLTGLRGWHDRTGTIERRCWRRARIVTQVVGCRRIQINKGVETSVDV